MAWGDVTTRETCWVPLERRRGNLIKTTRMIGYSDNMGPTQAGIFDAAAFSGLDFLFPNEALNTPEIPFKSFFSFLGRINKTENKT